MVGSAGANVDGVEVEEKWFGVAMARQRSGRRDRERWVVVVVVGCGKVVQ